MTLAAKLKVKLFADGADLAGIRTSAADSRIMGFTTNPTLMRKAGVADYTVFAREVLDIVRDRPVSFEVFADDFATMEAQALEISSWADNVNVKIPVTNTKGVFAGPLLTRLSGAGVKLNVTALLTLAQVERTVAALGPGAPAIVSVFAGRIADAGRDPVPLMGDAVDLVSRRPGTELLWASPREILNVVQADSIGCHIITATSDILKKLELLGKDLDAYSLETVKMFYDDARVAGYAINTRQPAVVG